MQPKICWKAVGRNLAFAIVESGTYLTAPASFISAGFYNEYILVMLCSAVGKYFIYKNSDTTGAGDIMLNIQSLVKFPIPKIDNKQIEKITELLKNASNIDEEQKLLDKAIFDLYGFNDDEIQHIEKVN